MHVYLLCYLHIQEGLVLLKEKKMIQYKLHYKATDQTGTGQCLKIRHQILLPMKRDLIALLFPCCNFKLINRHL